MDKMDNMDILKSAPKSPSVAKQPNAGRRSFIWRMGAAVSAVLASAVSGKSSPGNDPDATLRLSEQLGILEDEKAIRGLHRNYENLINTGKYEEVADLFTDDGEVLFNGGVFKGKSGGVRRLYEERFKPGRTGRKIEPAPDFQQDTGLQQDGIKVAPDRRSAVARFPYSIQAGTPIISDSQLVKMARLHGEGIMKWWEGGLYDISYVKDTRDGGWKINKLEYRVLANADYRPGKLHADPISVPHLLKLYPEDPAGPDALTGHASET